MSVPARQDTDEIRQQADAGGTVPVPGRAVAVSESCREEMADGSRCGAPAETILWGKLLPSEAFGPRCYEHAAKHIGGRAVHDPTWAAFDLRRLYRYGVGTATPEDAASERIAAELGWDGSTTEAERLLARVHTLEQALGEWMEARDAIAAFRAALPNVERRRLSIADQANELDLIQAEYEKREALAARAVVLEGAAGQEQADAGGLASKPRGTDAESQP